MRALFSFVGLVPADCGRAVFVCASEVGVDLVRVEPLRGRSVCRDHDGSAHVLSVPKSSLLTPSITRPGPGPVTP
jgi:hypothetical protein